MLRPAPPEDFVLHLQFHRVIIVQLNQDGPITLGGVDPLHLVAVDVVHRWTSLLVAESDAGGLYASIRLLRRTPALYPISASLQEEATIQSPSMHGQVSPRHHLSSVSREIKAYLSVHVVGSCDYRTALESPPPNHRDQLSNQLRLHRHSAKCREVVCGPQLI